jgi:spore coat protein A, manganese oxidase
MQLINRQKFNASVDMETGKPSNIKLLGQPKKPSADEAGWKDTYVMYPGEVTRVIATFDLAGKYVWHCHILSHEDHEMMRPFMVLENNTSNTKSMNTGLFEKEINLQTFPNPFNNNLNIQFNIKKESFVSINVYDSKGMLVKQLADGNRSEGLQQYYLNGSNLSSGVYICEVVVDNQRMLRKLVLQK